MSYETRYATIKEDLRDIMNEIAKPFGKTPEDYVGNDYGFEFALTAADGEVIHATLLLEDGEDNGAEGGNIVLRVDHGDENIGKVAPNNYSDENYAEWSDDELWDEKIEDVRANISDVILAIAPLVESAASKP